MAYALSSQEGLPTQPTVDHSYVQQLFGVFGKVLYIR